MKSRPNILIIITDQQSHHALSCAGNRWVRTRAMDALAARGVRFQNAYCSYPLCTPARASQMTGRCPHQLGIRGNEGKFFWYHDIPREALLGWHFARAGYRCVWAGKDMPPDDGRRDFALLNPWFDHAAAGAMARFLKGKHERPFLAVANFVNPHNVCEWSRYATLHEGPLGKEPPVTAMPLLPANHGIPVNEPDIIRIVQREGPQVYLPQFYTPDDWRRYLWGYYRLVEKADRETGRVLEALRRSGQEDRTLVIFTADHGDGGAAHQWNQKMVLYEEVVRVPLIMAGPRVKGGRVESRLAAASLDLFPTCCEAAGIPVPEGLEGRSLLPLARADPVEDWRDAVFIETALIPERGNDAREQARNRGRCIVTGRWKYSVWPWGRHREHLVDLVNDPGEMVNEAVFSGNAEVLASMRARLAEWCRRTGDSFVVPGYEDIGPHHGWAEVEANRRRFPPQ